MYFHLKPYSNWIFSKKTSHFKGKCEIIELTQKLFFRTPLKEEVLRWSKNEDHKKGSQKTVGTTEACLRTNKADPEVFSTPSSAAETAAGYQIPELYHIPYRDPSHDPHPFFCILHQQHEKTSEELNSDTVIENVWKLCRKKPTAEELPYWETINRYLERLNPVGLQETINRLCYRLLRSRAFEQARIRGKYWQVIIDGTQLYSTVQELDGKCMYRIHKKRTSDEYREKLLLCTGRKTYAASGHHRKYHEWICGKWRRGRGEKAGLWTQSVLETDGETKKAFPRLGICIAADSLYACEHFFRECRDKIWKYVLRYKEGSIPYIAEEYEKLKEIEKNWQDRRRVKPIHRS